jgi:transposase
VSTVVLDCHPDCGCDSLSALSYYLSIQGQCIVEKTVTHLAMLKKMGWSAFQVFPVKKQMKALTTELRSLEDVMMKHKNELQQRHSNVSIEGRIFSENLRCILQSEVSLELGDGDSMALIEAKFVSLKKSPGRVSSRVQR